MITIDLSPEAEAQAKNNAAQRGQNVAVYVRDIVEKAIFLTAEDDETLTDAEQEAEVQAVLEGLASEKAGRMRSFDEFAAEMRAKYQLPTHLTAEELGIAA